MPCSPGVAVGRAGSGPAVIVKGAATEDIEGNVSRWCYCVALRCGMPFVVAKMERSRDVGLGSFTSVGPAKHRGRRCFVCRDVGAERRGRNLFSVGCPRRDRWWSKDGGEGEVLALDAC